MRTNGTTRRWLLTAGVLAAGASIGGAAQVIASARPAPADTSDAATLEQTQPSGSHPDVSDDGRWVVYDGLPQDSIIETDVAAVIQSTRQGVGRQIADMVRRLIAGEDLATLQVLWQPEFFPGETA